jgi:hypothetical protein
MVAVTVAGALLGPLTAGRAAANPVSRTLAYTCVFPLINAQPGTVKIETDIPNSAVIGVPTPTFGFTASVSLNAAATKGLRLAGIGSVEGTADAQAVVIAPQGKVNVPVMVTVPRTSLPQTGSLTVRVTGAVPSRTFSRPGHATITVGDFVLHLTPKDANGNVTFLGAFDAPCTLDPEQDNVVGELDIVAPRRTTGPPGGTTPTSTTGPPAPTPGPSSAAGNLAAGSGGTDGTDGRDVLLWAVGAFLAGGLVVFLVYRYGPRRIRRD